MTKQKHFTKKWRKSPSGFELTNEDLHNLYELAYLLDKWHLISTRKLKELNNWYDDFFTRIKKTAVPELWGKK